MLRRLPDRAQHLVLGLGGGEIGQVGQRREQRLQLGVGLPCLLAAGLDLGRELLEAGELVADLAALALARRDLLGGRLLLGAQRLGRLRRVAPGPVERDDAVDALGDVAAAPGEGRPHRVGVAADQPEVQHGGGYPPAADFLPAYSETNAATCCASGPVTMFSGMIAPEKPPLAIAKRTSGTFSLRKSRFGPSTFSLSATFVDDPCVPAASSVWQAPQRAAKMTAPLCVLSDFGTEIASDPQPDEMSAAAARLAAMTRRRAIGGADDTEQCPGRCPA
jgi:hypothetical protein